MNRTPGPLRFPLLLLLALVLLPGLPVACAQPANPNGEDGNLALGNPSGATPDTSNSDNFLLIHPQYVLSYNRTRGGPNWVSWHVQRSDFGRARRSNAFAPDPLLPTDWQIRPNDYQGGSYERGHQCPSADRTATASDNRATFLMSNMLPQAADVNEHVWEGLESYSRDLARGGNELYIVAGGQGSLGTIGGGRVNVPAACWKVVVVLPDGPNDLARIDQNTRVIAVMMPNVNGIAQNSWRQYLTTPQAIEAATGLHFFTSLPPQVRAALEAKQDSGREVRGRRGPTAAPPIVGGTFPPGNGAAASPPSPVHPRLPEWSG